MRALPFQPDTVDRLLRRMSELDDQSADERQLQLVRRILEERARTLQSNTQRLTAVISAVVASIVIAVITAVAWELIRRTAPVPGAMKALVDYIDLHDAHITIKNVALITILLGEIALFWFYRRAVNRKRRNEIQNVVMSKYALLSAQRRRLR